MVFSNDSSSISIRNLNVVVSICMVGFLVGILDVLISSSKIVFRGSR